MIINKIKKVVEKTPNKIAYKVDNDIITYKELWNCANETADILKSKVDSPVIIYGNKEINVIKSIISCLLAGRTYVPIGICTPLPRLKKIVELTNSKLILTDEDISIEGVECCKLDNLKCIAKTNAKQSKENEFVYIIFTSGSTGEPKGVPISKENLENFVSWISNLKPLCEYKDIVVLNQASFSFDLSVADLYYSLCNGHTLVALNNDIQENLCEMYELMKNINVAVMTPTFMKICLLNKEFNAINYPNLKCVYFCGESLENKLVKKLFTSFPNINIINAYGPTEATSAVSAINITKQIADSEELLPVGEMSNLATEIEIINNEIVLKGKSVFNGYLNNIKGGHYVENKINCYKTGDLGFIKDNKLYCKGRIDNQIKYKGYRIELSDIEHNLSEIKGIEECAVVAKLNENNTVKTIKAFVVGKNLQIEYIKKELENKIPGYMMPKTIKIIEKLPVNQNGKLDRRALKEL